MSAPPALTRAPRGKPRFRGNNTKRHTSTTAALRQADSQLAKEMPTPVETPRAASPVGFSQTRFSEVQGLHKDLLAAIPYEFCTEVQAATLPPILAGRDVLAQAKTGTGKTMGFLIPSIQHLIEGQYPQKGKISILIISPTRELAQQIAVEAERITGKLAPGRYGVRTVVGGTNVNTDIRHLQSSRTDILVGTPGRMVDLLEKSNLKAQLKDCATLVLDEADRLLDQGFRRELTKILEAVPNPNVSPRQTLLFSATIPKEVHTIASLALKKDHDFISTLTEEDTNVHEHVKQDLIIVKHEDLIPATLAALQREAAKDPNFKVIVFLPTARAACLFNAVFSQMKLSYPVWEIHSRLSQSRRTKTTEEFKAAPKGVLFSSDVTARGIDIKGVTAVVQAGVPSSPEQYIHRLGRTARAGAEGHGVLILADFEQFFVRKGEMTALPIEKREAGSPAEINDARQAIEQAMDRVPSETKSQAYSAWLGYYKGSSKAMGWSSETLVRQANDYARDILRNGPEPPGLLAKTVGMMGLKGVPGLRIVKPDASGKHPSRGGGGGGGGGFGGGGPKRGVPSQGGRGGFGMSKRPREA